MTRFYSTRKEFRQGEWQVLVYDDEYVFGGPAGFAAFYPGKSADRIDLLILYVRSFDPYWAYEITHALPRKMRMPMKLVRDVERYVRATYEWVE